MQSSFGRSVGCLSEVSTAVLTWISYKWISLKIQSEDARVFDRYRLKDYADCLRETDCVFLGAALSLTELSTKLTGLSLTDTTG